MLPEQGQPAAIAVVRGGGQEGHVGDALPDSVVVRVTDARGRPVAAQRVAFSVSSGGAGAAVAPDTATTDGDGSAGASWTLGAAAGPQAVTALVVGASLTARLGATAVAAAATTLAAVRGNNQAALPGHELPESLVVLISDRFGNPVPGVPVAWTATGGGSVSPASVSTGADGHAAAHRVLGTTFGVYGTTATVAGLSGSPMTFVALGAAPPGSQPGAIAVSAGDQQHGTVGATVAVQPAVLVRDLAGQPLAGAPVTFQPAQGSGSVTGSPAVTDANGIATLGGWQLGTVAGGQTLVASVTGSGVTGNPVTFNATADPGPAAAATSSATVPAQAAPLTVVPIVVVTRDAFGNAEQTGGAEVTVTVSRKGSDQQIGVNDNGDGTYSASYLPLNTGTFSVRITVAGAAIPGSPFSLKIALQ